MVMQLGGTVRVVTHRLFSEAEDKLAGQDHCQHGDGIRRESHRAPAVQA
jgi:hypothetical protein